jgi:hypothetical protein
MPESASEPAAPRKPLAWLEQVFTQYVAARFSGNAALERFYVDRFPPDVRKA